MGVYGAGSRLISARGRCARRGCMFGLLGKGVHTQQGEAEQGGCGHRLGQQDWSQCKEVLAGEVFYCQTKFQAIRTRSPVRFLGPDTQGCPGMMYRSGQSSAELDGLIPMRGVTTASFTVNPSSRSWKRERGEARSRPLWLVRRIAIAWQSRLGPEVSCAAMRPVRTPAEWMPRLRAICSQPATGSRARMSTQPACPLVSQETFMQK